MIPISAAVALCAASFGVGAFGMIALRSWLAIREINRRVMRRLPRDMKQ